MLHNLIYCASIGRCLPFFGFWFLAWHNYNQIICSKSPLAWWYGKINLNFEIQCHLNSHCVHEHGTKTNKLRNLKLFNSMSKCALNNRGIHSAIYCFKGGQMCQNIQKLLEKCTFFLSCSESKKLLKIEEVAQKLLSRVCLVLVFTRSRILPKHGKSFISFIKLLFSVITKTKTIYEAPNLFSFMKL